MQGDPRYSVRKEFTGAYEPAAGLLTGQRWVARFEGDYIGSGTSKPEALAAVAAHQTRTTARMTRVASCGATPVSRANRREPR